MCAAGTFPLRNVSEMSLPSLAIPQEHCTALLLTQVIRFIRPFPAPSQSNSHREVPPMSVRCLHVVQP